MEPLHDALCPRIACAAGPGVFRFVRDLDPGRHVAFVGGVPPQAFAGLVDELDLHLDTPAFLRLRGRGGRARGGAVSRHG